MTRDQLSAHWRAEWEASTDGSEWAEWLERKLLDQAGYVADLQRQCKALILDARYPHPAVLAVIGHMAKDLGISKKG